MPSLYILFKVLGKIHSDFTFDAQSVYQGEVDSLFIGLILKKALLGVAVDTNVISQVQSTTQCVYIIKDQ